MKKFFQRFFKKRNYWACHYEVRKVGSDKVIESCTFPILGSDYSAACADAEKTVKRWVKYSFDTEVEISLYKPNWLRFLS